MPAHNPHPKPTDRDEFLVDGCPRCTEYADELGLHFTPDRWRAFWRKMIAVEFDDNGSYASGLDKRLGRALYYIALSIQRATALDPRWLFEESDADVLITRVSPFELKELLLLIEDGDERANVLTRKLIGHFFMLVVEIQSASAEIDSGVAELKELAAQLPRGGDGGP